MFGLNIDPNNPRGNPNPEELSNLGVEMVRYTFYDSSGGGQVDPARVQFYRERARAYRQAGIASLIILTYDTYPNRPSPDAPDAAWDQYIDMFARRAGQIAQALAEWRPAFQVWNEPDHPVHPNYAPTLREGVFGRMLRQTYQAIKAVDRNLIVVTGGLASGDPGWLTRVIQSLGGNLPADAVAFHPYGQRPDPSWPHANWAFGYVGNLLNSYYQVGQGKPLWITEIGVKEEDVGNNRSQAGEFLRRYYQTITTQFSDKVQFLHWFCYSDGMVPSFGLMEANGNRKAAFDAYRQAVAAAPRRQPTPTATVATTTTVQPPPPIPATVTPPPLPAVNSTPTLSTPPPPNLTPTLDPFLSVPTPTGSEPEPIISPNSSIVTQLSSEVAQMQLQIAQIQGQMQQLLSQQVQLQSQIQQLQAQRGTGVSTPPTLTPPPTPALGPSQPAIQNITEQLTRHPTDRFPTRPLNQIERLIVHHTAVPPSVDAERIAQHRVDRQGWPGIGYHYFITGEGAIQQTNDLTTTARHAGSYDPVAIGICFAGDFTNASPTAQQLQAGAQLIVWLLSNLRLSLQALFGYKELVNTQSPGLQWDGGARWGEQLKAQVKSRLGS